MNWSKKNPLPPDPSHAPVHLAFWSLEGVMRTEGHGGRKGPFSFRPCCLGAYSKPAGLAKRVEIECTHDMLRGKLGEINLFHLSIHPSVLPSMLTSSSLIPYSDSISFLSLTSPLPFSRFLSIFGISLFCFHPLKVYILFHSYVQHRTIPYHTFLSPKQNFDVIFHNF